MIEVISNYIGATVMLDGMATPHVTPACITPQQVRVIVENDRVARLYGRRSISIGWIIYRP